MNPCENDFDFTHLSFLFTHIANNCFSTMGVPVTEFDDLYTGTRYTENKALSAECPRYCDDEKRLERCDAKCECAYVREILHTIKCNEHTRLHKHSDTCNVQTRNSA